jgi:hypothetical protein
MLQEKRMRLSKSTRDGMRQTTREMLSKIEGLCQRQYSLIECNQKEIEKAQRFLAVLELEYLNCKKLLDSIKID